MDRRRIRLAIGAALLFASQATAQSGQPAFVEHPMPATDALSSCVDDKSTCPLSETSLHDIINWVPVDQTGETLAPPTGDTLEKIGDNSLKSIEFEVFFEYNSYRLTSYARQQIDALVPGMIRAVQQNNRLVFVGHTDSVGGYDYNLDLSKRRARAVGAYVLSRLGVAPEWIGTQGLADREPRNTLDTTAPENRRVQLVLYPI